MGAGDLGSWQWEGKAGSGESQGHVLGGPHDLCPLLLPTTQSGHSLPLGMLGLGGLDLVLKLL